MYQTRLKILFSRRPRLITNKCFEWVQGYKIARLYFLWWSKNIMLQEYLKYAALNTIYGNLRLNWDVNGKLHSSKVECASKWRNTFKMSKVPWQTTFKLIGPRLALLSRSRSKISDGSRTSTCALIIHISKIMSKDTAYRRLVCARHLCEVSFDRSVLTGV